MTELIFQPSSVRTRCQSSRPVTKVTWTLEALDDGRRTRVTLVHDGFEQMADRGDYLSGWAGFLNRLSKVVLELA